MRSSRPTTWAWRPSQASRSSLPCGVLKTPRPACSLGADYGACTSPRPTFDAGSPSGLAVASSLFQRFMPRKLELVSAQSAAQPATCGVAMLVPLLVPYRFGRGTDEKTSRPGAASSILPKFEKLEVLRFGSSDATDMIVGEFAGAPVFMVRLPAAAMIRQPRLSAAWPAAV